MKVLVMSEERWGRLAPNARDRHNTYIKCSEFEASMTTIDIPDGCVLAVVENSPKPDFSVVKGANGALHAAGITLGQEAMWDNNYRKVVKMEER